MDNYISQEYNVAMKAIKLILIIAGVIGLFVFSSTMPLLYTGILVIGGVLYGIYWILAVNFEEHIRQQEIRHLSLDIM